MVPMDTGMETHRRTSSGAHDEPADPALNDHRGVRTWIVRAAAGLILLLPLVFAVFDLTGGRFEWRMFSVMGVALTYEVEVDGEWYEADLGRLVWLDRGRHYGTGNLEELCDAHPEAERARRTLGDGPEPTVIEVRC